MARNVIFNLNCLAWLDHIRSSSVSLRSNSNFSFNRPKIHGKILALLIFHSWSSITLVAKDCVGNVSRICNFDQPNHSNCGLCNCSSHKTSQSLSFQEKLEVKPLNGVILLLLIVKDNNACFIRSHEFQLSILVIGAPTLIKKSQKM